MQQVLSPRLPLKARLSNFGYAIRLAASALPQTVYQPPSRLSSLLPPRFIPRSSFSPRFFPRLSTLVATIRIDPFLRFNQKVSTPSSLFARFPDCKWKEMEDDDDDDDDSPARWKETREEKSRVKNFIPVRAIQTSVPSQLGLIRNSD